MLISGIYALMIFLHVLLYAKNVDKKQNFWFILISITSFGYTITTSLLLSTNQLNIYLDIWRIQMFITATAMISLVWFSINFAECKKKKFPLLLTIIWMLIPIIRLFDATFFYYKDFKGIKEIVLPWNEVIYQSSGVLSNFTHFFYWLTIFTLIYSFIIVIKFSRKQYKRKIFLIISLIYFGSFVHDMSVYAFNLNWIQIAPLSSLSMLLIISVTIFNNIIDSDKFKQKIQLQKEQMDLAINSTSTGLWNWQIKENKITINEIWANIIGYKLNELEPVSLKTLEDKTHPNDLTLAKQAINDHLEGKFDQYEIEFRMKHKNGKWVWILAKGKIVERDKSGDPIRMTGTHLDITHLKEVEASLNDEKELLSAINENIPIGIVLWTKEGNLIHSNKALHDMVGYTFEEIDHVSKWFDLAYPDEKYRLIVQQEWTAAQNKNYVNLNFRVRCKNGEDKEIDFKSVVFPDGRALVTLEDISEKLQKDREVRETRNLLNTALEQAPIGILIADAPDVAIKMTNKAALEINGEDPDMLIDIDVSQHVKNWKTYKLDGKTLINPHDLPLSKAILKGEYVKDEIAIIRDNMGLDHWVQSNAAPIHNEKNEIIAGIVLFNDITKQIDAERDLAKAKNYIDNIINSMPSTIIGIDENLNITHWNKKAEERTSISITEDKSTKIEEILPELTELTEKITTSIRSRQVQVINKSRRILNNKEVVEDIIIYPLISNGITGAVIRIDDITNKVNMEEMMIQSEKMLSVGGLAAGMAHEINNPLAGMMQNASVLLNRLSKDSPKNLEVAEEIGLDLEKIKIFMQKRNIIKLLKLINSSGQRASELVNNMLSFARKSESKFRPSNLKKLLENTLELVENDYNLKKHYDFKKIEVLKEYQDESIEILCEETKLQQVFLNILKNGAEAMYNDGNQISNPKITIRLIKLRSIVRIEIENNGPPIPREIRTRIFEPFFTTKGVGKGTGLGLSVSYFIIKENHKGTMRVESDIKYGTKFLIELPINLE